MESPLASLLWRSLRVYQVFGANTDVGKTIFTTLLARTVQKLWKDEHVAFLKPVSTGAGAESDDRYGSLYLTSSARHISRFAPGVARSTLYQYDVPCSPHAAAIASGRVKSGPPSASRKPTRLTRQQPIPSDDELLAKCRVFAAQCATRNGWLFLETAGGVHSPGPSGRTQADLYIPLRAPSLLVGDSRLGGISQTISAFESLRIRGYDVESVLLFQDGKYGNYLYLQEYFHKQYSIPVASVLQPPEKHDDPEQDAEAMKDYYNRKDLAEITDQVLRTLDRNHAARLRNLDTMATRASQHIWYPFTQQSLVGPKDIMAIDSAHGDYFQTLAPPPSPPSPDTPVLRSSFDASASWWTQGLGHSNPKLTMAAAYAAGRYGHVMFASAVHQPAMALAETLLEGMKNPRLKRVFYSDNGSTGIEVAVKMGLRAARRRYGWDTTQKLGILGLRGSYHGDTMGAMDCSEPGIYNEKIEWYQGKGHWLDYPTILCRDGKWSVCVPEGLQDSFGEGRAYRSLNEIFDVAGREANGEHDTYKAHIASTLQRLRDQGHRFGALMLEPVVLGAGGMELVDPLFQRTLVNTVRECPHLFGEPALSASGDQDPNEWAGLPVVFDEVFTGLYRLGRFTSSSFLGVHPDISVHAKLLTGGLVPLCTTLASESIFKIFLSPDKTDALLHGHSYTAHPIGCQVAWESVREMQGMDDRGEWDWAKKQGWTQSFGQSESQVHVWSTWPRQFVERLSHQTDKVSGVWALGSVLAIHLKDEAGAGYSSNAALGLREHLGLGRGDGESGPWNVHSRVLGNVLYVMASQVTSETSVRQLSELLMEGLAGRQVI
ncbi:Aminotransferase class-III [Metarhizium album ARSEF 1941]|uniref:Aminotransferase class-III n=1 Tax=Metarhizium album (strain ARSEF 1941) TaxID=1081103 RepID=A0A0B2WKA3_METAS|nr:Aminotransferase class-III [Metarhizium album ARSEF 1941]KHN94343.1 Aminotransferase class-III [Metarhizium album ARSEF 1941]